jgi:hypothetical protein
MPRHKAPLSAILAVLTIIALPFAGGVPTAHAGPPAAAGPVYVDGIDDLPLMPGLVPVADQSVVFDKPGGRIIQAVATGSLSAAAVKSFYADTAPQLGWQPAGDGRFTRDGELLRIELVGGASSAPSAPVTVRFVLIPQK